MRQVGIQEADIETIMKPITKYAVTVDRPEEIAWHLDKAIHLATTGRKGPVWIDLPLNVQIQLSMKSIFKDILQQNQI